MISTQPEPDSAIPAAWLRTGTVAAAPGTTRMEGDGALLRLHRTPRGDIWLEGLAARSEMAGQALLARALPALQQAAGRIVAWRWAREVAAWALDPWGFDRLERLTMARAFDESLPAPLLPDGYLATPFVVAHIPDLVGPALAANGGTVEAHLRALDGPAQEALLAALAAGSAVGPPLDRAASLTMTFTGTPIGAILVRRPSRAQALLGDIFLAPEHQGQGLGRALILLALRALAADGATRAEVETSRHLAGYHLLRRLGFAITGSHADFFWLRGMAGRG